MPNHELVAEVRRQHKDTIHISEPTCDFCLHDFPCDALRLADEVERLQLEVKKWRRIRTPTHGNCCTCQACGLAHDDCRCDLDELADENERLTKLIEAKDEYHALLLDELDEITPLAIIHGWKSTHFEAGVKARAKIAALTEAKHGS